jgi:hypothetical protein
MTWERVSGKYFTYHGTTITYLTDFKAVFGPFGI